MLHLRHILAVSWKRACCIVEARCDNLGEVGNASETACTPTCDRSLHRWLITTPSSSFPRPSCLRCFVYLFQFYLCRCLVPSLNLLLRFFNTAFFSSLSLDRSLPCRRLFYLLPLLPLLLPGLLPLTVIGHEARSKSAHPKTTICLGATRGSRCVSITRLRRRCRRYCWW